MAVQTEISGTSPGADIWEKEGKIVSFYDHQWKAQRMTLGMDLGDFDLEFPIIPFILDSYFAQDFY